MSFLERLHRRAAERPRRVGFPEADEERTAAAVERLAADGLVRPVVVAADRDAERLGARFDGLELLTPPSEDREASTEGEGADAVLAAAAAALADGRLDGVVAGARSPTAGVVRAALRAVGPAPGVTTVSSSFYLTAMARDPSSADVLTFTDAGVVPDPDEEQLVAIASAASDARRAIVGDEPRVAFLSYATHGSAGGRSAEKVRRAAARFREARPDVPSDGELQADAALVAEVAARKAPGSSVAGRANVLVFPDLGAANIAYKLVERLAGARALGPILQGLARPMNDLSRGASIEDVIDVACITALMASESDGGGGES